MVVFMLLPSPITHQCIRSINNISKIIYELKRHTFSPWPPKSEEWTPFHRGHQRVKNERQIPQPISIHGNKNRMFFFESPGNLGFKLWKHRRCRLNPKLKKKFPRPKLFQGETFSRTNFFKDRTNFFKDKLFQGQTFSTLGKTDSPRQTGTLAVMLT